MTRAMQVALGSFKESIIRCFFVLRCAALQMHMRQSANLEVDLMSHAMWISDCGREVRGTVFLPGWEGDYANPLYPPLLCLMYDLSSVNKHTQWKTLGREVLQGGQHYCTGIILHSIIFMVVCRKWFLLSKTDSVFTQPYQGFTGKTGSHWTRFQSKS